MRRSQLAEVDVERHAADAVDFELERGDAAVQRRPVVLQAGRHADRLRLDVHRDLQQRLRLVVRRASTRPARRRPRRSAPTSRRCRRRPATRDVRRQRDAARLEEVDQQREQPQLAAVAQLAPVVGFDRDAGVLGADDDARVGRGSIRARGAQADRGVERLRAGMEEVERPDVDRAARQIDARRRRRLDDARADYRIRQFYNVPCLAPSAATSDSC